MRILWVKSGGVVPADTGGRIRSLQILKELARGHAVTIFTYYAQHAADQHSSLNEFSEVATIPIALPAERTWRDYLRYAQTLVLSEPYSMQAIGGESGGRLRYYDVADIRRRLDDLIARTNFDVLICDFIYPAALIDWTLPFPKILFTHNVEADLWKQQAQLTNNPLKKFLYWKECLALGQAERRYARLADHVVTVSEQNRAFFARYVSPARVSVIDTGVDVDAFSPGSDSEPTSGMVFTGSMDWMPNQDAMQFFTSEILPHIRAEVPESDLWIVGRCPNRAVQDLAAPRIHVTGRVADIRPYLERALVYVVPLRSGSGTRIKIFEAMAMGKAVVSTTLGAEGLPVTDGENILIADQPREFASAVVRLLRDRELAARLGQSARALVEHRFTSQAVGAQFESILQNATGSFKESAVARKTA